MTIDPLSDKIRCFLPKFSIVKHRFWPKMSNWSDSTFQFVRRTPRPISASTFRTPPSKDDKRNPTRIDTPRPPPNFPIKRQLSIPPNASNAKKALEEVGSGGPNADAKVNVTTFCAAREVQLKETERKLELMSQDNEKLKEELNQSRLQVNRLETFNQQLEVMHIDLLCLVL